MKKEAPPVKRRNPVVILLVLLIVAGIAIGGYQYWQTKQSAVAIEKASVSAPVIGLAPVTSGIIERVYVHEGDTVRKNQIVALVGNTSVYAKTDGLIISVRNAPGAIASATDPVVKMIDPSELRIVGRIEEDKGLADLHVGQRVRFTVDAFGDQEFYGVLDSIKPTSRDSDIVFSISDKREEKEFDISVRYDIDAYPQLRNGMSARMWVDK